MTTQAQTTTQMTPQAIFIKRLRALPQALKASHKKGMTLIEIMIVVTIMASIMAVAGVFVIGALDDADIELTKTEIGTLIGGAKTCYLKSSPRQYPDSISALVKCGNVTDIDTDAWGTEYRIELKGKNSGTIASAGPDGSFGTEDDITLPIGKR